MNRILLSSFILYISWPIACLGQAELHLKITGIEEIKGWIQIGIYNEPDDFPIDGKEYQVLIVEVDDHEISYTVRDLPPGNYAVAFYHETNLDSICNLNFLGIPKEGYGFSRNYQPKFRAPRFDETMVSVIDSTYIEMKPIY